MGGAVSFGWVPAPPNPTAEFIVQPRIYTYKVTFEEIPDWYWGAHKETKYGELYLGSPNTHAWKWGFYTPHLQICEVFPYTDEGWAEARDVEDRCILPDLNNPLCLNEHVGGLMSLEASRRGAEKAHEQRDEDGKSLTGVKGAKKLHEKKDELGRSVHGVKSAERLHKEKDELGRSVHAVRALGKVHDEKDELGRSVRGVKNAERLNKILHAEKDDLGRSVHGVKSAERLHKIIHAEKDDLGRSVLGVKNAERLNKEKDDLGRSVSSVRGGQEGAKITNAQKWRDPQHPELGEHPPGPLARMQRARGYPHGKENRVLVKQGNSQ